MAPVLEGLTVVDVSWGIAGPVATMLLSDYGADVVKVEPPGGDPFRANPGYTVWNRGKKSAVLDLAAPAGVAALRRLAVSADVLVESFAPGTTERLGIDYDSLRADNERLIYCSVTGYGRRGGLSGRPGYDALVQARSGIQGEQPGLRDGPIFLHLALPSFGAALLASAAVNAALHAREITGRGQWVETSLMQGALLFTTQIWKRAQAPTPDLMNLWMYKELGPTPCFEAGDAEWFHPMPQGVPIALAHVGRDPGALPQDGITTGDLDTRVAYFDGARELYLQRPRQEWVDLLQANDVPCQPVCPAETAFEHPQVIHNGAVTDVEIPGVGPVRQVGHTYHLELHDEVVQGPPPVVGQHTEEVLASLRAPSPSVRAPAATGAALRHPLDGIRVLDFGTAVAGPFAAMILSDLGADVIKVENISRPPGTAGDAVWAACQRGKRCISIDLKAPDGKEIARKLVASSDVIHYNLRVGVAERLGFGYEQAKAINPRIIFSHLTGYGNTGPLATWPGVDQMAQALCGLEYEQGATPNGGHPTWYRFGMVDAVTGMLSAIGILQALFDRDRTGNGQAVEANILSAGMLLASDAFIGPDSLPTRQHLDRNQTGLGPLYRLYQTGDGWICVAALFDADWQALCKALERPELAEDRRFSTAAARRDNSGELSGMLERVFRTKPAAAWFTILDGHGVPCEISSESTGTDWYDDPDAIANGWVVSYQHPVWGRLEQPGCFFELSETPSRVFGPPPIVGGQTREILAELGYPETEIDDLRARGVVGW